MKFRINSNIQSLNAQRNLARVNRALSRSFERLSSGLRINSARDDAAGLAITDRFSALIRSLNQAGRNANDGISLAQVAEAALAEQTNILLRIRELAVQAANDTNTTTDRTSIQAEVDQLIAELNRIGNNTEFNNRTILDGSFGTALIQVGANAGQTISISLQDSRATALGATASVTSSQDVDQNALAAGDVAINGHGIAASVATDDTKSFALKSASAIAKAAAINKGSGQHGVVAKVESTNRTATAAVAAGNLAANDLVINNVDIGIVDNVVANDADGKLVAAINAKAAATGVTATISGGVITLTAQDGRNITVTTTAAGEAITNLNGGAGTQTYMGRLTLTSDEDFVLTEGAAGRALARLGIAANTYNVDFTNVIQGVSLTTQKGASDALAVIDVAINQVAARRGDLGAVQNRLESTIANLEAVVENYTAASSRIKDADFAAETAELTRAQIIQQAATSMLAQANSAPQAVLSLLGR